MLDKVLGKVLDKVLDEVLDEVLDKAFGKVLDEAFGKVLDEVLDEAYREKSRPPVLNKQPGGRWKGARGRDVRQQRRVTCPSSRT